MITLQLSLEEGEVKEFEFFVGTERVITLSFNKRNLSLQIPGGVKSSSISNSTASFFARTNDRVE